MEGALIIMSMSLTVNDYIRYLENFSNKLSESKDYITGLDAATGDGDHWANLDAGFTKLMSMKALLAHLSFPELFKTIGMTLMSTVGGSSGILYASAYLKAAKVFKDEEKIDIPLLDRVLSAERDAIMERGGAKPGWKTMLDPLYQAINSMQTAEHNGEDEVHIMKALKKGAQEGMEATRTMEARKGRACYQKNKGVGSLDVGAVTMCYLIEMLADSFLEGINKK